MTFDFRVASVDGVVVSPIERSWPGMEWCYNEDGSATEQWNSECRPINFEEDEPYLAASTINYGLIIPSFDVEVVLESKIVKEEDVYAWGSNPNNPLPGEWRTATVDLYKFRLSDGKQVTIGIESSSTIDKDHYAHEEAEVIARTRSEFRGDKPIEKFLLDGDYTGAYAIQSQMRYYSWAGSSYDGNAYGNKEENAYHEITHLRDKDIWSDPDWDLAVQKDDGKYVSQYAWSGGGIEDIAETSTVLHGILYYKNEADLRLDYKEYFQRSLDYAYHRYDYLLKHWYNTNIDCVISERPWLQEYKPDSTCIPEPDPEPEPEPTPEPDEYEEYEPPTTELRINGTKKNDQITGTKRSDYIKGKKGDDILTGAKGADYLRGDQGEDYLNGSKGKDYLNGNKGTDILRGGGGADVFQISKGTDVVEDFNIKQGDRIALTDSGIHKVFDNPNGVIIKASSKERLLLEDASYDDIITAGVELFVIPV